MVFGKVIQKGERRCWTSQRGEVLSKGCLYVLRLASFSRGGEAWGSFEEEDIVQSIDSQVRQSDCETKTNITEADTYCIVDMSGGFGMRFLSTDFGNPAGLRHLRFAGYFFHHDYV